jgi:formate dehydrogenase maturation protein FdhE
VLYPIEEIKTRLSEWEHELIENSCKVLNITRDEYQNGVDLFLYQEGEEGLKKDYTEVKKHFRSWLKRNLREIKATKKQHDKSKLEQIINASEEAQPIIESYFKNRNNG